MGKIIKVILAVLFVVAAAASVYLGIQWLSAKSDIQKLKDQNAALQGQLSEVEESVPVSVLVRDIKDVGKQLKEEDLITINVPISALPSDYVQDLEYLNTHYVKMPVKANTILTESMLMEDRQNELTYYKDIPTEVLPVTLKVGDYVDVRLQFSLGEDYCVSSNNRVYAINSGIATIKCTKEELLAIQSATKDQQIYRKSGAVIYLTKNTNPGGAATTVDYPIRSEMAVVAQVDNDITDKNAFVKTASRDYLESRLNILLQPELQNLLKTIDQNVTNDVQKFLRAYDKLLQKRQRDKELKELNPDYQGEEELPIDNSGEAIKSEFEEIDAPEPTSNETNIPVSGSEPVNTENSGDIVNPPLTDNPADNVVGGE